MRAWIGVDFDGTLVEYDGWKGVNHVGKPIPAMVERVKRWRARGVEVRIFTARVGGTFEEAAAALGPILAFSREQFGEELAVTNEKDYGMVELWDDRCVQVEPNTGRPVDPNHKER